LIVPLLLILIIALLTVIIYKTNEFIRLLLKINHLKRVKEYGVNSHACLDCDLID